MRKAPKMGAFAYKNAKYRNKQYKMLLTRSQMFLNNSKILKFKHLKK